MDAPGIGKIVNWEIQKFFDRGYLNILSLVTLLSYLYFIPRTILFLSTYFPESSPPVYYTVGTYLIHLSGLILSNLFFFFIYYLNNPWIESFKINSDPWPWQSDKQEFYKALKKVFKQALINQLITTPTSIFITGLESDFIINSTLPPLTETLVQIIIFVIIEDFVSYFTHRILHLPWFYRHVHKKHHEFKVTISCAAEYAHPFEYCFGNALPFISGPLLYGQKNVHVMTWFAWVFIRAINTSEGHSGYELPWSPFAIIPFSVPISYHDFHHSKNIGNYGSTLIYMDSIFNTNWAYWKSLEKKKA